MSWWCVNFFGCCCLTIDFRLSFKTSRHEIASRRWKKHRFRYMMRLKIVDVISLWCSREHRGKKFNGSSKFNQKPCVCLSSIVDALEVWWCSSAKIVHLMFIPKQQHVVDRKSERKKNRNFRKSRPPTPIFKRPEFLCNIALCDS